MYELDQEVWVIENNSIQKLKVGGILIRSSSCALKEDPVITYELGTSLMGLERRTDEWTSKYVYATKEELLASL